MKKVIVLLVIGMLIIISCSGSDEPVNELTLEQKIIGKWKLTKQVEAGITTDYSSLIEETTHHYKEDGSIIFHEWGETFFETYEVSGSFLYHMRNSGSISDYKIISISDQEMILDLLDNSSDSRVRHYIRIE